MQEVIHLELIIKGMFYNLRVELPGGTDCTALTTGTYAVKHCQYMQLELYFAGFQISM